MESQSELGTLQAWQKKLFDDEVVPQFQSFIKNYRSSDAGLAGEVDLAGLKNYLKFYAPEMLKSTNPKVVVLLRPQPECDRCVDATQAIQKLMKSRLEHRGFLPVFITAEEAGDAKATGKVLEDKVSVVTEAKGSPAYLLLQWQEKAPDDEDAGHEDEKQYQIYSSIYIRGIGKTADKLDLLQNDSFETAANTLVTNAWKNIGSKDVPQAVALTPSGKDELSVEVTGIKDYADFSRIKNELQARLKESSVVQERKLTRGKAVFAVRTGFTADEVKAKLGGFPLQAGQAVEVR